MQQMLAAVNLKNTPGSIPITTPTSQPPFSEPVHNEQRFPLSSASNGQAAKLLATHLPDFSRSEDEDVESWIHTVEKVAQIYVVSNDVLLAATGKLKKIARKWLEHNQLNRVLVLF